MKHDYKAAFRCEKENLCRKTFTIFGLLVAHSIFWACVAVIVYLAAVHPTM